MSKLRRCLLLGLIPVVGCFGKDGVSPTQSYGTIAVRVTGSGTGAGFVTSTPSSVGIGCRVVSGRAIPSTPGACQLGYSTGGVAGSVFLDAVADSNSVFNGWTGCSSVSGARCTLSHQAGVEQDFDVVASFRLR